LQRLLPLSRAIRFGWLPSDEVRSAQFGTQFGTRFRLSPLKSETRCRAEPRQAPRPVPPACRPSASRQRCQPSRCQLPNACLHRHRSARMPESSEQTQPPPLLRRFSSTANPSFNQPDIWIRTALSPVHLYVPSSTQTCLRRSRPQSPSVMRGGGVGSGGGPKRQCSSGVRVDGRSIGASIPHLGEKHRALCPRCTPAHTREQ
jgi:hypothetical protein